MALSVVDPHSVAQRAFEPSAAVATARAESLYCILPVSRVNAVLAEREFSCSHWHGEVGRPPAAGTMPMAWQRRGSLGVVSLLGGSKRPSLCTNEIYKQKGVCAARKETKCKAEVTVAYGNVVIW